MNPNFQFSIFNFQLFLLLCFSVFLLSCQQPAPQLPANKGANADSVAAKLLTMNEKMIVREDSLLGTFVKKNDTAFQKHKLGFWYKIEKISQGEKIAEKTALNIHYRLFLLNNTFLKEETARVELGKKQLTTGLEEGLKLLRKGESAKLVVPFYLAFGVRGNGAEVPPYTSVMYEVEVKNN